MKAVVWFEYDRQLTRTAAWTWDPAAQRAVSLTVADAEARIAAGATHVDGHPQRRTEVA